MENSKKLNKKAKRLIENIFDVMLQTTFEDTARKELTKDLKGHNVSLDKMKGLITIEDEEGVKILYTIKIEKV